MYDEDGTQELCRQVEHWLFGTRVMLGRPGQASDQADRQVCAAPSEDTIEVRCLFAFSCSATRFSLFEVYFLCMLRNGMDTIHKLRMCL